MDKLRIIGGQPLHGTIAISGAKNAALPLLCTALLTDAPLRLHRVPPLSDIRTMLRLLAMLGAEHQLHNESLLLHVPSVTATVADYELMRTMRAGVLVLGPLLARCGAARVSLPGGCAIGSRPVDLHLKALSAMGAEISLSDGYINAVAPRGLSGARIVFPYISVGATENALMAATIARGETVLENAACEPEIGDLARCLVAMGAKIDGIDTHRLRITGVPALQGAEHTVVADRIELGSYAMAVAATRSDVVLTGGGRDLLPSVIALLESVGATIDDVPGGLRVRRSGPLHARDVVTAPFPAFPTDLQAQFTALMCVADGFSTVHETIFENRFMHVPELRRMNADIELSGNRAFIRGVAQLKGAPVMATDLRASFGLIIAALMAQGTSEVRRIYHLDRGYHDVAGKLQACGAQIERLADNAA